MTSTVAGRSSPTRSPTGSQRRAERTRRTILDATVDCIREVGSVRASGQMVVERAGVTWGSIQYHFGDRVGLLAAVVEDAYSALMADLAAIDTRSGTRRERLTRVVDDGWRALSQPAWLAAFAMRMDVKGDVEVARATLATIKDEFERLATEALADDHGNGPSRASDGRLVLATLRGLAASALLDVPDDDAAGDRRRLVDLILLEPEPPIG